jgi:hypothetical protein
MARSLRDLLRFPPQPPGLPPRSPRSPPVRAALPRVCRGRPDVAPVFVGTAPCRRRRLPWLLRARHGSRRDLTPAPRDVSAASRASSAISPIPSRARSPAPRVPRAPRRRPRSSSGRRPVDAGGFRGSTARPRRLHRAVTTSASPRGIPGSLRGPPGPLRGLVPVKARGTHGRAAARAGVRARARAGAAGDCGRRGVRPRSSAEGRRTSRARGARGSPRGARGGPRRPRKAPHARGRAAARPEDRSPPGSPRGVAMQA